MIDMNRYYFIPIILQETIKPLINTFEGYVCLTAIEPPRLNVNDLPMLLPTGIMGQAGEVLVTQDCKGFLLEGDLQTIGYHGLAIELGCTAFDTAQDYLTFIQTVLS